MRLLYSSPTPVSFVDALLDRKVTVQGKRLKLNSSSEAALYDRSKFLLNSGNKAVGELGIWLSGMNIPKLCSFSRCNQFTHIDEEFNMQHKSCRIIESSRNKSWDLQEIWKVKLGSCIDASPLIVVKNSKIFVFIGSHSCIFYCLDAQRYDLSTFYCHKSCY